MLEHSELVLGPFENLTNSEPDPQLYRLESCDSAIEEDEAKLWRLDCNSATEGEEDDFKLLEGWLSAVELRWNS
jgi:hypothetical protein